MQGDLDYWRMDRPSRLPVRYMPPESFVTKRFDEKSDVWSFGVANWEIMRYALMLVCHIIADVFLVTVTRRISRKALPRQT